MIKEFKDLQARPSGVIYASSLEQIKKLYSQNPEMAGELAISVIEQTLTGDITSNDLMVQIICEGLKPVNQKAQQKYDIQVQSKKESKCENLQLQRVIELSNMGKTQEEIGKILGVSRQAVNNRIRIINEEYPELKKQINVKVSGHVIHNDNVDDNDNVDEDVDVDEDVPLACEPFGVDKAKVISLSESIQKAAPAAGAANKKVVSGNTHITF